MMSTRTILAALLVLSLGVTVAAQSTIVVPSDFPTIQSAIQAAQQGDWILVLPGTYHENLEFLGKSIIVQSVGGPDVTFIDGGHQNSVVRFIAGETQSTVLHGFTLQNGLGSTVDPLSFFGTFSGGGIYCFVASPRVVRCRIRWNGTRNTNDGFTPFPGGGGGGVSCINSNAIFQDCEIIENTTADGFGFNSILSPQDGGPGGGIYCDGSINNRPSFVRCTIARNVTGNGGEGLVGLAVADRGGNGGNGGGVAGRCRLVSCVISDNVTGDGGPGSQSFGFPGLNGNGGSGGGVHGDVTATNCTIANNVCGVNPLVPLTSPGQDGTGGGAAGGATLVNSIVWGNMPNQLTSSTADFSNVEGGFSGTANIDADPLFLDEVNGNYRPALESPCVDRGDASAPDLSFTSTDVEGLPRLSCGTVDMGAFEVLIEAPTDGCWYVEASSPAGCGSRAAPFNSISAAIVAAADGDTINVLPGVYTESLFVDKDLVIQSQGGAEVTILRPATPMTTIVNFDDSDAILHGFAIEQGSLAIISSTGSPTVQSCIIRDNAGFVAVILPSGEMRLENCLVHDNDAGIGFVATIQPGGQIINCTFADNSGAATLRAVGPNQSEVVNSIFWNQGTEISGQPIVTSSLIEGGFPSGNSVLDTDPLFVDPVADDYRLQGPDPAISAPGSPAIDFGTNGSLTSGLDLSGMFRVRFQVDLGAYEFHQLCGPPPLNECEPGGGGNGSLIYAKPGTNEDFLIFSTVNGQGDYFADYKFASAFDVIDYSVLSPELTFSAFAVFVFAELWFVNDPVDAIFPNSIHLDTPFLFEVDSQLGPGGILFDVAVPPGVPPGLKLRMQAFTLAPPGSTPAFPLSPHANFLFSATPAFDVEFQ